MIKVCRHCKEEFDSLAGKPGFVDECPDCLTKLKIQDVAKLKAVVESPKRGVTGVVEIMSPEEAERALKRRQLGYLDNFRTSLTRQELLEVKRRKRMAKIYKAAALRKLEES